MHVVRESDHPDVDTIYRAVRDRVGQVSLQAIYDGLHALHGVGILRKIEPMGSPARYEARVGDNHHHLVCRSCGTVVDVDCATGAAPCLDPVDAAGFIVDEADVIYWGICSDCHSQST
jgi:Fur family ferric uptake transcriptional regulator